MKEYIAKTGGRYTYNDDLLNLQELALSMSSIFEDCSNFIISGCQIENGHVTPGNVWINGKVRHFTGSGNVQFPFYIYESNQYETVTYAGDVNKHGRCLYLCVGATKLPTVADEVTDSLPQYIEIREDYAPRLFDKFIGRHAVLLDTPFQKQSIKKDIDISGVLKVNGNLNTLGALILGEPNAGNRLLVQKQSSGDYSISFFSNQMGGGALQSRIDFGFQSIIQFRGHIGTELVRIDQFGLSTSKTIKGQDIDTASLRMSGNDIYSYHMDRDDVKVCLNRIGYKGGKTRYRTFEVYDGRSDSPLFAVEGQTKTVTTQGKFRTCNQGLGIEIGHMILLKTDKKLTGTIYWTDKNRDRMASLGYDTEDFDFSVRNSLGNIVLAPKNCVDVIGVLKVNGIDISTAYVSPEDFSLKLSGKVDKVTGKGLSEEDFTATLKKKLDAIKTDPIGTGTGYVIAKDVHEALSKKINSASNLADLPDNAVARMNLSVYSRSEGDLRYLRTERFLAEFTEVTVEEIEGLGPDQITALLADKARKVRQSIRAEEVGTGDKKLDKSLNLSDISDKAKARQNIGVYSIEDIDRMLAGKIDNSDGYQGVVFTTEHKAKLDGIKTGRFAGPDESGVSQAQAEGYALVSGVMKEFSKYAPRLLTGYSATDKVTLATNLGVYSKTDSDSRYGLLSQSFQDFINYHVKFGKSTAQAQQTLRDKLNAPAKSDLDVYVRKDKKLSDLSLPTANDKKLACQAIGAAYASEYQTKVADTGWIACGGHNAGTLWARQIGNVVCIQGIINTGKRASNTWGSVATIPNTISPPRFGCRQTMADFNDNHKYNRGCSFIIRAGGRDILMHERGTNNVQTELSFSYMT